MWYIDKIYFDEVQLGCLGVGDIDKTTQFILKDYNKNIDKIINFDTDSINNKEQLLKYLRDYHKIIDIIGIGTEYIFEITNMEFKLLEYIDYNGRINRSNVNKICNKSVIWDFDKDNLLFSVGYEHMSIARLILSHQECYIIKDNLIIILVDYLEYLPSYKILCDINKFDRLLTKLKVLSKG